MNFINAIVFVLLTTANLALLLHLRQRRQSNNREQRLSRCLQMALQREVAWTEAAPRPRLLRRAS
jgi:hypothetical protein